MEDLKEGLDLYEFSEVIIALGWWNAAVSCQGLRQHTHALCLAWSSFDRRTLMVEEAVSLCTKAQSSVSPPVTIFL